MRPISHPSKEQVRAYMRRREHAVLPPPPPEEIRRQLCWSRIAPPVASVAAQSWHQSWRLSAEIARLGALMTIAWLMHSGVAHRKN